MVIVHYIPGLFFAKLVLKKAGYPFKVLKKADSPTRRVGECFRLPISPRIQNQHRNGSKGCVRDLWGTNFYLKKTENPFHCHVPLIKIKQYFRTSLSHRKVRQNPAVLDISVINFRIGQDPAEPELEFSNFYGAQESIPRNQFRQPN